MNFLKFVGAVVAITGLGSGARAQPASTQTVVVTAERTGVPFWRATRGGSTLILVGTIRDIAQGTNWNSAALDATVSRSQQVMFPQLTQATGSPFAMIGWLAKWKRRARLPAGQTLSAMLSPDDRRRLAGLAERGLAPRDWDRTHPLHLAFKLHGDLRDRTGVGPTASATVQDAIRRHKVRLLPIQRSKGSAIAGSLFATRPQDHVSCLAATLRLVEGGSAELRRRSQAWASRQVAAAIASPAEAVDRQCWPATARQSLHGELLATSQRALAGNATTLAVLDLGSLAGAGGLLDQLQAQGVDVRGPSWR